MTDSAAQAEGRWALADEQAQRALAGPAPRRVSLPIVAGGGVSLVVLIGVALSFPPESTGRLVTGVVGAAAGFGLFFTDAVRAIRDRSRRPERTAVTKSLSPREQRAVQRVIRRRQEAPDDRLDVVRAAAAQAAAGRGLPMTVGLVLAWTSGASMGTPTSIPYAVVAGIGVVTTIVALRDVVLARRYLAETPAGDRSRPLPDRNRGTRSGHGDAPS
ncbi:hypothetical protein [Curtobacterium pusillum]|uniref:hypothetical protein n=1 Tax=Curtobacterium pusillum TaxID=69373 RepID=UPI0011A3ED80|nr:hypothetical protein [Curtobacterium pusillum]